MVAAAKVVLTDRAFKALKPADEGRRYIIWDAMTPHLGVRVTDKGAKSFIVVKRRPGARDPDTIVLGKYPAVQLKDRARRHLPYSARWRRAGRPPSYRQNACARRRVGARRPLRPRSPISSRTVRSRVSVRAARSRQPCGEISSDKCGTRSGATDRRKTGWRPGPTMEQDACRADRATGRDRAARRDQAAARQARRTPRARRHPRSSSLGASRASGSASKFALHQRPRQDAGLRQGRTRTQAQARLDGRGASRRVGRGASAHRERRGRKLLARDAGADVPSVFDLVEPLVKLSRSRAASQRHRAGAVERDRPG